MITGVVNYGEVTLSGPYSSMIYVLINRGNSNTQGEHHGKMKAEVRLKPRSAKNASELQKVGVMPGQILPHSPQEEATQLGL